jgi:hypothetical protein
MRTSIVAKRCNAPDDAAFLQAEAKLTHLLTALDRLADRDPTESEGERLIDEACGVFDWIRQTEPATLAGAAVKLRTLLHPELGIEFTFHPDDDPESLRQVLAVIDREVERRA